MSLQDSTVPESKVADDAEFKPQPNKIEPTAKVEASYPAQDQSHQETHTLNPNSFKTGIENRGKHDSGKFGAHASHLQPGIKGKKPKMMGAAGGSQHPRHAQGAVGAVGAQQQYALKDNSEMLKSINTNKM